MATKSYESLTDDYKTPKEIYQTILDFIKKDKFEIDVCCTEFNIPANRYFTKKGIFEKPSGHHSHICTQFADEVNSNWHGSCFMNPPWKYTAKWLKKAFFEAERSRCEVWCVLPGDRLNMKFFNETLREKDNWFIAVLENNKYNFYNPHLPEEENQKNIQNGGFKKPIFVLYIGENARSYAIGWTNIQPLKSLVLTGGMNL